MVLLTTDILKKKSSSSSIHILSALAPVQKTDHKTAPVLKPPCAVLTYQWIIISNYLQMKLTHARLSMLIQPKQAKQRQNGL